MANNVFKVDNGLTVSGGDLRVVNANAVDLRANTSVTGDASVSANLAVTGNTSLARTTISGNFLPTANGRVIGDTTSTFDTHTGNNVVYGRMNPSSNGVTLGTSSAQWDVNARNVVVANAIYVAGVVEINSLGVSATVTNANNLFGLTTTGIIVRTSGAGAGFTRTITGSNTVTVVNGDGVAGNPTLSLPLNSGLFSNSQGIFVNASSVAVGQLPITYGGTGATSALGAFTNIVAGGVAVNTTASAYSYILSTDNAGNYVWAVPNPPPDTASSILSKLLTVDGSSSNLDADLLDGYNTSTSDSGSTVAVRTAEGYLYASYFNQTAAAETPTIGNVIVTNTTDGFYRKISNTNFISGLGLSTQSYAAGQAATAYANAVLYTNAANTSVANYAASIAGTAYTNATLFSANASNINSGTLAEARLPFRMDQNVRTTDTVTFGNMTVNGNLTVSGTTTYINTQTLNIGDNIITLNADLGLVAPNQDAGFEVNRGTQATVSFLWDETNDRWTLGSQNLVAGTFIGALSGNATTATTLQTGRNINGTTFNGSTDITTATWGTARDITIGSTTRSVNGSGNYSWSLADMGAAAVSQTMHIGTTAVAINRASAGLSLTGVSIDGNAGSVTNGVYTSGSYSDPSWLTISASKVGLGNVTNESKATMFTNPTFTGTVSGVTATHVGLGNVTNESKATMFSNPTFTGTVSGVTATHVGLGNVTNESKATMFSNPTFTGTVSGVTKSMVGLGNVDNTADASKSVNYATSAGNADTVDSQNFSYSNSSDSPTYLWATNTNGTSFLAARANISVNYAASAGAVAWTNVSGRPTALSSFTNDVGYVTSSGVTSVSGTTGRITSSGGATPAIDLATAGAGAATYSSGISAISVDAYGRVTSVSGSAGYVTSSGVTSVATGTYMTGGTITSTGTIGINANTGNIASTVVARDASGNFAAGTITATLSGSASSVANALTAGTGLTSAGTYNGSAARTFSLASGVITSPGTYSSGISAITVDTYGRVTAVTGSASYLTSVTVTAGSGLTGGGSGSSLTLNVGAGSYITVAADSVAVDATTTATASKVAARDASGDIYANDFQATSDARLKTDIVEIQNALDRIEKINGVKFKWNELATNPDKDKVQVGVIAQEVEAVVPEIVNTNDDGYKSVSYDKLVPLLIQAVKELSEKVKKLEGK